MTDERTTDHTDDDTRVNTNLPTNVIAAIARVEAEIGGIAKLNPAEHAARRGQRNPESGINYSYRGIDQIAQAAQPLLGRYGIVIVPTVENHVVDELTVNGRPWTETTVTVIWHIYGPGGGTDFITSRTVGVGRDNSDKGMNKAMTGAYKNLLLRILTIGDPQDDTDHERHETDAPGEPAVTYLTNEQAQDVVDTVVALHEPDKTTAKHEIADTWGSTKTIPADQWDGPVRDFLERWAQVVAQQTAGEPDHPQDGDNSVDNAPTTEEHPTAAEIAQRKREAAGLPNDPVDTDEHTADEPDQPSDPA